jgi:hypothetical protein
MGEVNPHDLAETTCEGITVIEPDPIGNGLWDIPQLRASAALAWRGGGNAG